MSIVFSLIYGIIGLYTIFAGFRVIFTGKLSSSEEKNLAKLTEKSQRTYKRAYAAITILIGLLFVALTIIKILLAQKIMLGDEFLITIIFVGAALLLAGILGLVWLKCKKGSNNDSE